MTGASARRLAHHLVLWRELTGHSQAEAAQALGMAQPHLSRYERGENRTVSLDTFAAFVRTYRVPEETALAALRDAISAGGAE